MSGVRNSLTLFAAGVVMAGTVQAQDKSASFSQIIQTNSNLAFTVDGRREPTLQLGSNTSLSGLFVDCSKPAQTWAMLVPSGPALDPQVAVPPARLPVSVPRSINDPAAVQGADFVILRLSFP